MRTRKKIEEDLEYTRERLRDYIRSGESEEDIKCIEQDVRELEKELDEL